MAVGPSGRVRLAYGRGGLEIEVPAGADVLEPRHLPGLRDVTRPLEPVEDVSACVAALLRSAGPGARLAVLPRGPQTIPYVADLTG